MLADFPWLHTLAEVPQDPIYHAEGDVLTHTRLVAAALVDMPAWRSLPEQERATIWSDFEKASAWAKKNNRPLFLGEFGAYDKGPMESRARYTAAVARAAEQQGWSWAYWQFDSDFIVYDLRRGSWVEPILHALVPPNIGMR